MKEPPAIEVVGYLNSAVGVGEAARRYAEALRSAGAAVCLRDIPLPGRDSTGTPVPSGPEQGRPPAAALLCVNPEQLASLPDRLDGGPEVGLWSWEVDVLPAGWREAAATLSEVWTYSRFAAALIESGIGRPVFHLPPPVSVPNPSLPAPDLPKGFRVLVVFDYLSTLERKNPLGAIAAFRAAFEPGDGAVLILKSMNGRHRPERVAEVQRAVAGRPDILCRDETLTGGERDALLSACDCVLSMHRSEGHGMPLAEAMAAGKPVVATAYGGNVEFMDESNSYPVRWKRTVVGDGVEHYPAGAHWAEPDIGDAAAQLRAVWGDREGACVRAERAHSDVLRRLEARAIGERMIERLRQLEREGPNGTLRARVRAGVRRAPQVLRGFKPS